MPGEEASVPSSSLAVLLKAERPGIDLGNCLFASFESQLDFTVSPVDKTLKVLNCLSESGELDDDHLKELKMSLTNVVRSWADLHFALRLDSDHPLSTPASSSFKRATRDDLTRWVQGQSRWCGGEEGTDLCKSYFQGLEGGPLKTRQNEITSLIQDRYRRIGTASTNSLVEAFNDLPDGVKTPVDVLWQAILHKSAQSYFHPLLEAAESGDSLYYPDELLKAPELHE